MIAGRKLRLSCGWGNPYPPGLEIVYLQLGRTRRMVLYVALIAIVNIGLGYALATYVNSARQPSSLANSVAQQASDQDFEDDYYSDEPYDDDLDDAELEAAVAR